MARILWAIQWWQLSALTTAAPVAVELRSRGHQITFLSTAAAEGPIRELGFRFRPHRRVPDHDWGRRDRMPASLTEITPEYWRWVIGRLPDRMMDVVDAFHDEPCDLIIADGRLPGAGLAAERCGVPWAAYIDVFYGGPGHVGAGWPRQWNSIRQRLGFVPDPRPVSDELWLAASPHLTVVFGLPQLSAFERTLPPYVHEVGPLIWDLPMVGSAPEWLEDIGVHRPAILVSTSSGWLNDSDLVVAAGDALRGCDVDVVATLPAEPALPAMPDNVHVARYLPHSLVMPRVDLLVCSGGLGVVNRALLAGKPMVAVPRGADGYRVTAAAVAAGVAVGVDQSQLGPETLRAVLLRALEDPAIRTNAEALQRAGSSFDAPVTTANLMESLLGG